MYGAAVRTFVLNYFYVFSSSLYRLYCAHSNSRPGVFLRLLLFIYRTDENRTAPHTMYTIIIVYVCVCAEKYKPQVGKGVMVMVARRL